MKLPSIKNIVNQASDTILRFSFTVFIALLGTFAVVLLIQEHEYKEWLFNFFFTCLLGVSFTYSLAVYAERQALSIQKKMLLQVGAVILLGLYFWYLPLKLRELDLIRTFLLLIAFHLFAAFAPFTKRDELNGFWHYNKTLFLQGLTSILYSAIIYAGLAGAMLAIDNLFGVEIKPERYGQLWVTIIGIFNTIFFLSGVPKDFEQLDTNNEYPQGLKIITQYVLLPIVTIYLLILYAYSVKILIQWQLPIGWVSYLILGFSVAGIFSLLLLYPLQETTDNQWIKIYSRRFYWAVFPLIILLFVAIGTRISEYGITEKRYFVLILAFWLAGISIFMLYNRLKNIRVIPVSLCLIAILSSFGPWSAFNVSILSQKSRLERVLTECNIFVNGKVEKTKKEIPFDKQKKLSTIIDYLVDNHGYKELQPYFKQNFEDKKFKDLNQWQQTDTIMKMIGLKYISRSQQFSKEIYYTYTASDSIKAISVKNYDYMIDFQGYYNEKDNIYTFNLEKDTLSVNLNSQTLILKKSDKLNLSFNLEPFLKHLKSKYDTDSYVIAKSDMILASEDENWKVQLIVKRVNGYFVKDSTTRISNLESFIFLKKK